MSRPNVGRRGHKATSAHKAPRAPSLLDWAKATPRNSGGLGCAVCRHPDAAADILSLLEYRRAGNETPGLPQVFRELARRYPDAKLSLYSVKRHVAAHAGGWRE